LATTKGPPDIPPMATPLRASLRNQGKMSSRDVAALADVVHGTRSIL
jgi:hypothetical protein